tara:strand:- start:435 stop:1355 length:921 start_codon:yes stop_codon:yes gene_type:complete
MKNILVTGGAGFIGSSLVDKLLLKNYFIIIADDLSTGNLKNIQKTQKTKFVKCDVNDFNQIKKIFNKYKIDYVFHFAACVGVIRTIKNPIKVLNDIDGLKNIFFLSSKYKVKRIFFSSSSEVYGEGFKIPQNETTTPLNSRLPYAVVKNIGESFCKSYNQEYKLNYTIFRFFNTYGPKQTENFVVSLFIKAALKNKNLLIYGKGNQSRTFCYIDDTIDAIMNSFEKKIFINDIVNIGNDKITSINELARKIIKITNSKSKIKKIKPLKEGDMFQRQPEISKMKKLLNRKLLNLDQGIRKILGNFNS